MSSADNAWEYWLDHPRERSFYSTEEVFKAGYEHALEDSTEFRKKMARIAERLEEINDDKYLWVAVDIRDALAGDSLHRIGKEM